MVQCAIAINSIELVYRVHIFANFARGQLFSGIISESLLSCLIFKIFVKPDN